jgi:hypothetical protein
MPGAESILPSAGDRLAVGRLIQLHVALCVAVAILASMLFSVMSLVAVAIDFNGEED